VLFDREIETFRSPPNAVRDSKTGTDKSKKCDRKTNSRNKHFLRNDPLLVKEKISRKRPKKTNIYEESITKPFNE
jgi:hypothetical protein